MKDFFNELTDCEFENLQDCKDQQIFFPFEIWKIAFIMIMIGYEFF